MQFESKLKRNVWTVSFLGLIPDFAIAAIIAKVIDGGFVTFALALVGLLVLYLATWIKKSIWQWIVFHLKTRKHVSSLMLDELRRNGFPEPDVYEMSADVYFASIADEETLSVALRLKAMGHLAPLTTLCSLHQVQHLMQVSMAFEDAIERYKQTFQSRDRKRKRTSNMREVSIRQ